MCREMIRRGGPYEEPIGKCDRCGDPAYALWVDCGFGPYTVQAGPFHCYGCGWTEGGCPASTCLKERCTSWDYCRGEAMIIDAPVEAVSIATDARSVPKLSKEISPYETACACVQDPSAATAQLELPQSL